jgi:hypothetical protein
MATKIQTPLSPARQMLRDTLEAQRRARVLADKAQLVVDAANAAVERATEDSAKHEQMGTDAIRERLALLKGDLSAKTPEEIREAQRGRLLAKEELQAADQTLQAAKQEMEEFHGNVTRAERVANSHATAVISECVTDVIAEWEKVNAERERLRVILISLIVANVHLDALPRAQQTNIISSAVVNARLPYGDAQDWKHLQNKVGAALSKNFAQPDPGPSIAKARAYWATFADAILDDHAAEQAPLPSSNDLFS